MRFLAHSLSFLAIVLVMLGVRTGDLAAQTVRSGCIFEALSDGRQILRCQRNVTITVEQGARFSLADRDSDGNADALLLRYKAALVDSPAGSRFQVVTPQAIAAVRGTRWAVDVGSGKTAVFVERGRVGVQRTASSTGVVLGPGEGVDVDSSGGPLTVRTWGKPRVDALMARLGQ